MRRLLRKKNDGHDAGILADGVRVSSDDDALTEYGLVVIESLLQVGVEIFGSESVQKQSETTWPGLRSGPGFSSHTILD